MNFTQAAITQAKTRFTGVIKRFVEGQSFIATRPLVDNNVEQAVLEEILDTSKPTAITANARGALHYLLYTPFRYPPLKHGGRFHQRFEQSLFYASDAYETAAAEIAHYRFLFAGDTDAQLRAGYVDYTGFAVSITSNDFVHLTRSPFDRVRAEISNPNSYKYSQKLGTTMREAGVMAFDFYAARSEGTNYALYSVDAFSANEPIETTNWKVYITPQHIEFQKPFESTALVFGA